MTILEHTVLNVLLPGFTHHIDIGQGTHAIMSFGVKGEAQMILPGKALMKGEWKPLPDGYHVTWINGPMGDWKIGHEAGRLSYVDPTGRTIGTVTRIEPIEA